MTPTTGRRWPARILISPDKFKGTLTATEAAEAIRQGVLDAIPDAETRLVPIADGGEGTVDVVLAVGGTPHTATVRGPMGNPVTAMWAQLGETAVIEIAAASGLSDVISPDDESAKTADTFGTGELILRALDDGAAEIILGLGGSASTDGGAGILRALGARFLDEHGQDLPPGGGALIRLRHVDLGALDSRLAAVPIRLCCDVSSPLLGRDGSAAVFGPQKGASPATVGELDAGLAQLARVLAQETGQDAAALGWGGAAGGTAGGMHAAVGARFAPGTETLINLLRLDDHLEWADLIIVGEGSLDSQSLSGKAPIGAARLAAKHSVPAAAVAGRIALDEVDLSKEGIIAAIALEDAAGSPESAQAAAAIWVRKAAQSLCEELAAKRPKIVNSAI